MSGDLWMFGYGSLMWRPGFACEESHPARLHGYPARSASGLGCIAGRLGPVALAGMALAAAGVALVNLRR